MNMLHYMAKKDFADIIKTKYIKMKFRSLSGKLSNINTKIIIRKREQDSCYTKKIIQNQRLICEPKWKLQNKEAICQRI